MLEKVSPAAESEAQWELSAKVIRCGCADRGLDFKTVHGQTPEGGYLPCPQPKSVEYHGVIATADPVHRESRSWWRELIASLAAK